MIIYDIEIAKAIPPKKGARLEDIEYCEGWQDHANMGISCVGALQVNPGDPGSLDRSRLFLADNLHDMQELIDNHGRVVGFNNYRFDDCVMRAHGIEVPPEKSYDLLVAIWLAAGLGPEFQYPSHIGYGLDAMCKANGVPTKTGSGEHAPVAWQRGRPGEVIDYCLNDVAITAALYTTAAYQEGLYCPKTGGFLRFDVNDPMPWHG